MENKFDEIIKMAENESKNEDSFGYLPSIIDLLKTMRSTLRTQAKNEKYRKIMFGSLGRLVIEDYNFSESRLGKKILKIANQYLDYKIDK